MNQPIRLGLVGKGYFVPHDANWGDSLGDCGILKPWELTLLAWMLFGTFMGASCLLSLTSAAEVMPHSSHNLFLFRRWIPVVFWAHWEGTCLLNARGVSWSSLGKPPSPARWLCRVYRRESYISLPCFWQLLSAHQAHLVPECRYLTALY